MYIVYKGRKKVSKCIESKIEVLHIVKNIFDSIDPESDEMTKIFVVDTKTNEVVIDLEVKHF